MFIKRDLVFTELKNNIKLFLSKFGRKPQGVHDKEYWEALKRYKELVNDFSLQEKLQELRFLEALIIQTYCMQDIDVTISTNITAKNPCVYARTMYPTLRGKSHTLAKSLGPRKNFVRSFRSIAKDPAIIAEAKVLLSKAMEEKFIYKAYKIRYPN